jgi:hypothetical protein
MNDEQNAKSAAATDPAGRLDALVMRRRLWVGRWLFHSLWSRDGAWTVTKNDERYSLWLYFGPLDRPEGRAWMLTIWRWQLMFARA